MEDWQLINKIGIVEIWKTSVSYLTCYQYGGIFIFSKSLEEANQISRELLESLGK